VSGETSDSLATHAADAVATMERLAGRLQAARHTVSGILPLPAETFHGEALDAHTGMLLDGFRTRFAELEDVAGRVVVPLVARLDGLDVAAGEEPAVADALAWLAERGVLDADAWREMREVRNQLAHPEPGDGPDRAELLNRAWAQTPDLLAIAERLAARLREGMGSRG
jgi:hypothetical protein